MESKLLVCRLQNARWRPALPSSPSSSHPSSSPPALQLCHQQRGGAQRGRAWLRRPGELLVPQHSAAQITYSCTLLEIADLLQSCLRIVTCAAELQPLGRRALSAAARTAAGSSNITLLTFASRNRAPRCTSTCWVRRSTPLSRTSRTRAPAPSSSRCGPGPLLLATVSFLTAPRLSLLALRLLILLRFCWLLPLLQSACTA